MAEITSSQLFWRQNLPIILQRIQKSYTTIIKSGRDKGMILDEENDKQILGKCIYESLNRLVYE